MIKTVHVIYSFGIGGLEKGITTLINHGSDDIEHIIISLCGARDSEKLLKRPARIICLDKQGGNSPRFVWDLARVIRAVRPNVVHTRNWSGMDGILAARLARVGAVVHGEHGWDMFDPQGKSAKRRRVRKFLSPIVNGYTCVSQQLGDWLRHEVGIKKPVTQVYNGVDTDRFKPASREEKGALKRRLGLLPDDFVVGNVARLDAIKNHSALLQAFHILSRKHPDAKLLVVGDGPEMARLKAQASENIVFLGYRSDTDLLMKCFDEFVLPSFNEGISNTILEAMATGLPVVASKVGGNPELVADGVNGFLVDPYRPDQIAEKIIAYIQSPVMREQHGGQGRRLAKEKFSVEAMVRGYETVYRTVCL